MNGTLAPKLSICIGKHWVLWYEKSNTYSVVDTQFKETLDRYFRSTSPIDFQKIIHNGHTQSDRDAALKKIKDYLTACNFNATSKRLLHIKRDCSYRNIKVNYVINSVSITVYYDSERVKSLVHPQIENFKVDESEGAKVIFDIYLADNKLYLFKNEVCLVERPKYEFHFISGKFVMHIINEIHHKKESDWIGTFHGSTVTDNQTSILFIGNSGSGKSTISSLLVANGYYLLADDVSPMLADNKAIYYNPNGISIKEGAANVLRPIIKDFDTLPVVDFNRSKGPLRYHSCPKPPKNYYPCKSVILVNYKKDTETELKEISIDEILQTLIPESWFSHNEKNAQSFLNWLSATKFYKLTYSENNTMLDLISKVFNTQANY